MRFAAVALLAALFAACGSFGAADAPARCRPRAGPRDVPGPAPRRRRGVRHHGPRPRRPVRDGARREAPRTCGPSASRSTRRASAAPSWRVDPNDPAQAQPKLDAKVAELVGDALHVTPEMRCAARELARFYADHGANADERLQRFIVGACGATAP